MTIRGLLEKNVAERPGRNALVWCENKTWMRRTWREYLARVRDVAEGYGTRGNTSPACATSPRATERAST